MKKNNKKLPFSVSMVIPVYNNEKTIIKQLTECNEILKSICSEYEIIISDDLSKDRTVGLLKKNFQKNKNFRLIFQKKNLGIGKNIKFLYQSARKNYVMLYSADGDWNTSDANRMLLFCKAKRADLVIGKRIKKGGYNIQRKIISFFFRLLTLLFFGIDTIDAGSIKIIRKGNLFSQLQSESIFLEAEIIIRAKRDDYKILPLPVHYNKSEEISGSAGNYFVIARSFGDLIKFRLFPLYKSV